MWFLREKKAMAIYEIKNHKKAALIFGIVCICAMICTFIAQDSIQVNRKLALITEQYNELEQQYNKLEQDYDYLIEYYSGLKSERNSLKDKVEEYEKQLKTLEDLQNKYDYLQGINDDLTFENKNLQNQIESLEQQLGNQQTKINSSEQSYNSGSFNNTALSDSQIVWLPANGTKYHNIPNCGRMNPNTSWQTTKANAEASGYEACSKCW